MSTNVYVNSRILPFPKEKVKRAWTDPSLLSTWWGPKGFVNVFETCDVVPGGEWKFVMRSPEGVEYQNLSKWLQIEEDHILIEHACPPHFFLRADFEDLWDSTNHTWTVTFDTPEMLESLLPVIVPSNEENLDRLESCLRGL